MVAMPTMPVSPSGGGVGVRSGGDGAPVATDGVEDAVTVNVSVAEIAVSFDRAVLVDVT